MLALDPRDPTPPYEQIRVQITTAIEDGDLVPGDRLPTVRRLAGDLGIAPNTVARAYREMERAAVVETRGRHGTFVAARDDATAEAAAEAASYAARLRELGVSPAEGLQLVANALGIRR